jgi:hypothetical protein
MRMITKNRRETLLRCALPRALAVAALVGCGLAGPADAQVRTVFPSAEDPGMPFYARVEGPHVGPVLAPHTEDWAAIVFYRSPACVPEEFNLLDFFDVPAAFSCPHTVDGFNLWREGPFAPPPMLAQSRGLGAVPIWFVALDELEAAVADGVLTVQELLSLPSLRMGSASFFREQLRPTGGAQRPGLVMTAHGVMDDGQAFQLHHLRNAGGIRTTIRFDQ